LNKTALNSITPPPPTSLSHSHSHERGLVENLTEMEFLNDMLSQGYKFAENFKTKHTVCQDDKSLNCINIILIFNICSRTFGAFIVDIILQNS
jgi:hypothetical protein